MSTSILNKNIHIISATVSALLCIVFTLWQPSLIKDAPTSLGTIGSFATAYGLIFAIIELRRAQTASNLARQEAKRVLTVVTNLVTAREIIECQNTINMAISSLDEGKPISSAVLCQIVKLYSQVFHFELANELSIHRKVRSTIQSYTFNPNASAKPSTSKNTKHALLSITGQLAELQGSTKNFTEYTK